MITTLDTSKPIEKKTFFLLYWDNFNFAKHFTTRKEAEDYQTTLKAQGWTDFSIKELSY